VRTGVERWLASDPGHPLGHGYPTGSPLREDGETHRTAWMRLLRADSCAYCNSPAPSGTLDHIEPRARPGRAPGGVHCWTNYTGACERCNAAKAATPLLVFLAARAASWRRRESVLGAWATDGSRAAA